MSGKKMQELKTPSMMLALASAAGMMAVYGAPADAALVPYTWGGTTGVTTGGSVNWVTPTNWGQAVAGATYPQLAGDSAILPTLSANENWVTPTITLGALSMSPTATNAFTSTLTANPSGSILTFDNGSSAATITDARTTASSSVQDLITGFTVNLNSNLTITAAAKSTGGAVEFTGGSINGGTHTITKAGAGYVKIANQTTNVASTWFITGGRLITTGGSTSLTGDITMSGGGEFQNSEADATSSTALVTIGSPGTWNPQGNSQSFGAMAGAGGQWGGYASGDQFTLNGATTSSSTTESGYLAMGALTLASGFTGHTQQLAGTVGNVTGPVIVNAGTLQLNKTPSVGNYAISDNSAQAVLNGSAGNNGGTNASLTINGGIVQFLASSQIDPGTPITLSGGTLNLNDWSQSVTTALGLTASSTIDFGATKVNTNSILAFGDSSAQTFTGVTNIADWVGSLTGGGEDQLDVGTSADLTSAELAALDFVNPNGLTGTFAAIQLPSGEVVPSVPEPASLSLLVLGSGLLFRRQRKQTI